MPEFDEVTGYLPPGRYRVTPEEAYELLVRNERFRESETRARLWEGFEGYVAGFYSLEERYSDLLSGPLLHYAWLGGSYVSTKIDPDNIDLTVFIDDAGARALRGRPGAAWLTKAFSRASMMRKFGLSPIRVRYRPIPSVFQSEKLSPEDREYLRERGAWDDWWQRCRQPGIEKLGPTVETAATARGYLEVTLSE